MRDDIFAIIPARGGSERLPRKNLALLGGKPLMAWTIEAALASGVFADVWVSSEDDEILGVAQRWGARPLRRPHDLAGPRVIETEICRRALQAFGAQGRTFSALYLLLPTSPFRRADTIRRAWGAFVDSGAESLMSVAVASGPAQWSLRREDDWLTPLTPHDFAQPRAALPPTLVHDGGHIIASIEPFLRRGVFLGPRTTAFYSPINETLDINEPQDLARAELQLQNRGEPMQ